MDEGRKQEVEMEGSEKREIALPMYLTTRWFQPMDIQSNHTCIVHSSSFTTSTSNSSLELSFAMHTIPQQKRRLTSRAARNKGMSARKRYFVNQTADTVDEEYAELRTLLALICKDGPFAGRLVNQQVEEGHRRLLASMRRLRRLVEGDAGAVTGTRGIVCLLRETNANQGGQSETMWS